MGSRLDKEESDAPEITLSTASLLGIFFGLVLICGVFFGFGYSMGRGSGASNSAPVATVGDTDGPAAGGKPQPAALASAEPAVKPVIDVPADASAPSVVVKQEEPVAEAPAPEVRAEEKPATPIAAQTIVNKPSAGRETAVHPDGTSTAPAATPIAATSVGKPMVQIAAVARQEDAEALVSALRQRGYGVVVRNEPQDKLLHVQVGPFADRSQAAVMKQKLMSDGYNAIIKQ